MSHFATGPGAGGGREARRSSGSATSIVVLLAALGTLLLFAVTFLAYALGTGDDDPIPARGAAADEPAPVATAPAPEERVLLTLQVEGGGTGRVRLEPLGVSCAETCEHEFTSGTRVAVSAKPANGSRFEGWGDACAGGTRCTLFMDRARVITATFEGTAKTQCEDGKDNDRDRFVDERDPGCRNDSTEAPDNTPKPLTDCNDGRDNDSDGLIDDAQDAGCDTADTEEDNDDDDRDGDPDGGATPITPPPPPPATPECTDGRDNDGDGLTDRAQDPNCASGNSEGGTGGTTSGTSECRDGIDNDGDGKTDRPADPGCDGNATEVTEP